MTPKQEAALRQALEAMNLARAAHGQILLSDPPQEAWKAWGVSAALTRAMTAASEALAEQPAQQQEPVANGLIRQYINSLVANKPDEAANVTKAMVDYVYTSPPANANAGKPWVGLTDEEVDECYYWKGRQWTTDELVRHVEAKLREKNNG